MTLAEALRALSPLARVFGPRMSRDSIEELATMLLAFPVDVLDRAVARWIGSNVFPPAPAELARLAHEELPKAGPDAWLWTRVNAILANASARQPDEDPRVLEIVALELERRANLSPEAKAKALASPEQQAANRRRVEAELQRIHRPLLS